MPVLVLSAHIGEKIFIGDDIAVTYVRGRKTGEITLAFDAPREVAIDREAVRNSKRLGLRKPEGGTR